MLRCKFRSLLASTCFWSFTENVKCTVLQDYFNMYFEDMHIHDIKALLSLCYAIKNFSIFVSNNVNVLVNCIWKLRYMGVICEQCSIKANLWKRHSFLCDAKQYCNPSLTAYEKILLSSWQSSCGRQIVPFFSCFLYIYTMYVYQNKLTHESLALVNCEIMLLQTRDGLQLSWKRFMFIFKNTIYM